MEAIGTTDASPALHGREDELRELVESFRRAASGSMVFFLLSGRAGVGKTALVRALRKVVRANGGRMLEGGFDEDRQYSPYSALTDAIGDLVNQIDAEPEPLPELWRTRLMDGLGAQCALVCEMFPSLRRLIGPIGPAAELPWPAARHRGELAVRRLFSLVATREHPLLLFLDDIHWADEDSLLQLQALGAGGCRASLMIVATCPDEALEPSSKVSRMLAALGNDSVTIVRRGLGPLSPSSIGKIIGDMLGRIDQHDALVRLLFRLSNGLPSVAKQLLRDGESAGWLQFVSHPQRREWHAAPCVADPGIPLLASPAQRLARLPPDCLRALEVAALQGRRFEPVVIATLLDWTPEETLSALVPAAADEIIELASDVASARFCSGALLQAVSSHIDEARAAALRASISLACWQRLAPENPGEQLFAVVDQVNKGLGDGEDSALRVAVIALNLGAGLRALRIAAYRAACHYLGTGLSLLPAEAVRELHSLRFSLQLAHAEALNALGDATALQPRLQALSHSARTPVEHLRVRMLEASHHHHAARFDEALACGLKGLADAGVALPAAWDGPAINARFGDERHRFGSLLAGRGVDEAFASLPVDNDSLSEPFESLIAGIADAATMMNASIIDLVAIVAANRSLAHGCTRNTPLICSLLARALIARDASYGEARQLALTAMRLAARLGIDPWAQARLLVHQFSFVLPWSRHIDNNLPQIEDTLSMTTRTQDPSCDAALQTLNAITQFFLGRRLDAVTTYHQRTAVHARTRLAGIIPSMTQPFAGAAAALRGETASLTDLDCDEFDTHAYACRFKHTPFMLTLLSSARMPLHVLAGDCARALQLHDQPELRQAPPFLANAAVQFWRGMACAQLAGGVAHEARQELLDGLAEATDFLAEVECGDGGDNVTHRLLCLLGEQSRLQGDHALAFEFYSDAVDFADRNGYTLESGFILERTAAQLKDGKATPGELATTLAKAADRYREAQAIALYRRVRSRLHALPRETLGDCARPAASRHTYGEYLTGSLTARLPGALAGAHALIVDDDAANRKQLTQTLAGYLPAVATACSPQEAQRRVGEAVAAGTPFTLVVVASRLLHDIGSTFVRRVRRTHTEIMPPAFLLLTDRGAACDDAHLLVGFDAAISTPVDTLELFDTLQSLFSDDAAALFRSQRRPHTLELAGLRVLLCESDPTHRALTLELLRRAGMYADTAADGHGAVEQLRRSGPDRYSLVLMAFDLPGVDGLSATRMLRSDHRFDALPIIAMNTAPNTRTLALCLRAGMNDQLPRPLDADRLYDTLSLWVQPGALSRHVAAHRAGLVPTPECASANTSPPNSPRAEIAQLRRPAADIPPTLTSDLQRMQGNATLYMRLLGRLRAAMHAAPDPVRAALARTDIPTATGQPTGDTRRQDDIVLGTVADAIRQLTRALTKLAPGARNQRH